ncbi:DNA topoisomerase 2 [[Candida] anglica]|uniref:DNA topoisomerase 2 n=1 Tax=[Candida] anglica TaxID=148631 RepID=A0ABP0EFI5_9ASCO
MSDSESDYVSDESFSEEIAPSKNDSSRTGTPPSAPNARKGNASEQYKKLSQLDHILIRPDTYIGSVEKTPMEMWCFDAQTESMVYKEVTIVPGLYKIFDEILVNAADNKIRDPSMKNIRVKLDAESNTIEVTNDGRGIPIEIHDKEKIYIPELIFGNLLTSSNYDDDEKKVTGGRNGYGAKLCNIFSNEFHLETADLNTQSLYKQTWTKNMSQVGKPKITKLKSKKEYTKVTFKPDLARFGMETLDEQTLSVMRRRVYDLCGTVKDCNVYLNDKKLNIRNFKGYVEMYVQAIKQKGGDQEESEEDKKALTIVHEVINDRWELAFAVSDGVFNQVSFVNSIATTSGGTHVKYISDQIINKLVEAISKKEKGKKKLMIKPWEVRNNMFLFVNSLIENPAFTSQTKEQLTTKTSQFGGKVTVSDVFINKILKTSIVNKIKEISTRNEDKQLQKDDGSRRSRIKGQVKLVDANKAGTSQGYKCTLILTEGDSALSLAVAGLTVVGRDHYGCFPLRGKLLNVREASTDQVSKNAEITALKQIIGLQHKKHYTPDNIKTLRYGHIMIMTDQDTDGSHIKGLIINFLETSFPGLLEIPGFLLEFITPIIKVSIKGRGSAAQVIPFYNMPDFENWRSNEGATCRWSHKYYKGLGTSTPKEAIEYFSALDKHLKEFHALQGDDKELIDLAFSKKKADERKDWLQGYLPGTHLDPTLVEIPISEFINKELILFSMADNIRSIPSVLDGLKPGQRKVLFGCFKKNLKQEIKVSSLAGYVSDITAYHHGDQSLVQTIIGLAQNFIGSNNLNVLKPNGAFGTRAAGGKDFSAARYIFTELNEITRKVFNPLDNPLLTYVQDDEQTVEPEWYLPVLPMVLVNGGEGIGTGWSTNIPPYNPIDIVNNIRSLMDGREMEPMTPWFKGWEGDIEPNGDRFKVMGRIEQIDETTLEITELPVKTWTNSMKEFLLSGLGTDKVKPWIKDFEEYHGSNIRFVVKLSTEEMAKSLRTGLMERFKLISSVSLSNMVAFDPLGRIKKYETPQEILKDFYYVRMEYYQRRKDFMAEDLQDQLTRLSEQARFIKLIIEKQLSVSNKKRSELVEKLQELKFVRFDKHGKPVKDSEVSSSLVKAEELADEEELEIQREGGDLGTASITANPDDTSENRPETVYSTYDYLLGMAIWSLTRERYLKLMQQRDNKESELTELLKLSAKDLWHRDLDDFVESWEIFLENDRRERANMKPMKGGAKKRGTKRAVKKESSSEPPKKKPATKKITPPKSSTPAAIKKESTPDIISSLKKVTPVVKKKEVAPPPPKKVAPKIPSMFSESEDDEILGTSFSKPITEDIPDIPSTKTPSSTKRKNLTLADEVADLVVSDTELENIPKRRTTKKAAPKYKIEYISDDEDDFSDEADGDSDDVYEED